MTVILNRSSIYFDRILVLANWNFFIFPFRYTATTREGRKRIGMFANALFPISNVTRCSESDTFEIFRIMIAKADAIFRAKVNHILKTANK